mmetsp:Transcript_19931/g.35420  ORF Transcript_19931/g.35420 Transcript_19931/m.35420 type:complete len:177 (+) Transcript_19931:310-840(+)|eukprot:CAMPEP_0184529076 /NCGR_PEP_ID=MMETSP0198_2-20121128/12167_1 /TAXON_ID=1112570 /ORGANISM="Thraustochytrium sp., Strain LLF1b" /LENGTH=176 /DNA_ID=CAMNT_0026921035 /DNA_START=244 /DNA_END=774 /DNA_ORIENTATION=-
MGVAGSRISKERGIGDAFPESPTARRGEIGSRASALIKGRLYVGGRYDGMVAKLKNPRHMTHLLCLEGTSKYPEEGSKLHYLHEPLSDGGKDNLEEFFGRVYPFLQEAVDSHGKLLIHCTSGVNRGPAISIMVLMAFKEMSFEDAYAFVKSKRPETNIHDNYLHQLKSLSPEMLQH